MDKLNHLKKLNKLVTYGKLSTDEIRLFLLFLANCGKNSCGTISYETIKDICGKRFSTNNLKRACCNLRKHNLIDITFPPPDKIAGKDYALTYSIECVPVQEKRRQDRRQHDKDT